MNAGHCCAFVWRKHVACAAAGYCFCILHGASLTPSTTRFACREVFGMMMMMIIIMVMVESLISSGKCDSQRFCVCLYPLKSVVLYVHVKPSQAFPQRSIIWEDLLYRSLFCFVAAPVTLEEAVKQPWFALVDNEYLVLSQLQ